MAADDYSMRDHYVVETMTLFRAVCLRYLRARQPRALVRLRCNGVSLWL